MDTKGLKTVDIIVYALLLIGALNWGLVGLLQFDLVAFIFGAMTPLARIVYVLVGLAAIYEIVYVLVGLAAIYDIVFLKAIWKRWNVHY